MAASSRIRFRGLDSSSRHALLAKATRLEKNPAASWTQALRSA
jgi:hypothetical protein